MSDTLENVCLQGLVLEGPERWTGFMSHAVRTLAGGLAVWEGPALGMPLELVGDDRHGWLDQATWEAIIDLARTPNAIYALTFGGFERRVRFRHEDPPALQAEAVEPLAGGAESSMKNVRIRLMAV